MTQTVLPFDICERKHQGNTQSVRANIRAHPGKANMRERVRVFVAGCGWRGTTLQEIAGIMGKPIHALSGRLSELKKLGLIFDSGREIDGFAVYVTDKRHVNEHYTCTKGDV